MSNPLHTPAPPEFATKSIYELARLGHQAEATDDDILLLQVDAEVERRDRVMGSPGFYRGMCRDAWRDLIPEVYG